MMRVYWCFLIFMVLNSCGGPINNDYVYFESSQPENVNALSDFPKNIQGIYQNINSPTEELTIHKKCINKKTTLKFAIPRYELEFDSTDVVDVKNDKEVINYFKTFGYDVFIQKDTIFFTHIVNDTIFNIDSSQILKRFNRKYFLNYLNSDHLWTVKMLEFKKDSLFIGSITPSDTLLHFNFVTVDSITSNDSINTHNYIIKSSKKDFRKLIKSDLFDKANKYIRIKK